MPMPRWKVEQQIKKQIEVIWMDFQPGTSELEEIMKRGKSNKDRKSGALHFELQKSQDAIQYMNKYYSKLSSLVKKTVKKIEQTASNDDKRLLIEKADHFINLHLGERGKANSMIGMLKKEIKQDGGWSKNYNPYGLVKARENVEQKIVEFEYFTQSLTKNYEHLITPHRPPPEQVTSKKHDKTKISHLNSLSMLMKNKQLKNKSDTKKVTPTGKNKSNFRKM